MKRHNAPLRRIAARRKRRAPMSGVRPGTVEMFTRFVRLNPWLAPDSPVLPRIWKAYDAAVDGAIAKAGPQ